MKLGYLRMIRKPRDNQCSESHHHHLQDLKKHAWVLRISRPCWMFSLISSVLWWQSGYPAARW